MIAARQLGVLALAMLGLCGCEEKKSETTSQDDAAAQTGPALEPELAEAMEAASKKKGPRAGADPESGKGPPPNGIFEPGQANAELAKGAAPKITIGSEGSEPRVKLAVSPPAAGWKRNGKIDLTIRAGRSQLPVITTELAVEAQKAAKPAAGAGAPETNGGTPLQARVVKASVAPGAAGAGDLEKLATQLKGGRVTFQLLPSGASDRFGVEVAKAAPKDLDILLRPLSEILAAVTMPFPDKAVGKGAFWMVTSRETVMGVDVVTYRMVRVEDVVDETATLALSIKRYAASSDFDLAGVPPGSKLEQFQSVAEGELVVGTSAALLPVSGSLRQTLVAMLTPPAGGDPSQRMTAQSASEATISFPVPGVKIAPKPQAAPEQP